MNSANNVGTLVLQVDGGDPPSGGRRPGVAGSVGKVFLVSTQTQTLILDCPVSNHPINTFVFIVSLLISYCRSATWKLEAAVISFHPIWMLLLLLSTIMLSVLLLFVTVANVVNVSQLKIVLQVKCATQLTTSATLVVCH